MSKLKSTRKAVGSAFNASIQLNINKRKHPSKLTVKFKPLNHRQFYHSQTNLPFTVAENEDMVDSEDEYQLLDIQRHQKIVKQNRNLSNNQKKITNLWNEFVENRVKFGIQHMKDMCNLFIDMYIDDIRQQKLYHDFMLHLCTLYHGNLLSQEDFQAVIEHLHVHMGIQDKRLASTTMDEANNNEPVGKENHVNRKRKRSSSTDADNLEPKQKQQRYSFRALNTITNHG